MCQKVQAWIIFFLWRVDNNLKVINSNGTELLEVLRIRVSLEQKEKLSHRCIQSPHFVDIYYGESRLAWVEVQGAGHWVEQKRNIPVHILSYWPIASLLTADKWFHFATFFDILCKTFREPFKRLNCHFSLSFSFCAFNAYFTCENSE